VEDSYDFMICKDGHPEPPFLPFNSVAEQLTSMSPVANSTRISMLSRVSRDPMRLVKYLFQLFARS
jgi:hypothetical protein